MILQSDEILEPIHELVGYLFEIEEKERKMRNILVIVGLVVVVIAIINLI